MSARQVRVETRSRHQSDLKRVMHSTARVRKWEKKWVQVGDTSMQIFKWMPIKADEQQQPTTNKNTPISTFQQNRRRVLTSDNNQISTITIARNADRLSGKTSLMESKMLLNGTHDDIDTDRSLNVEQARLTSNPNSNDSFTSMHQQHQDEHRNKRKLNDLDLMSSDSCGSSSYGSVTGNDATIDSNSIHDELEVPVKRQKTTLAIHGEGDNSNMPSNDHDISKTTSNCFPYASTPPVAPGPIRLVVQDQDDQRKVLDDVSNSAPSNHNCQQESYEIMMDSEEELTDVARLVTEQIVTKVSDCYMDI